MRHTMLLILILAFIGCEVKDETRRANQLNSLRVLAVRSEPADLRSGDIAIFSALIHTPSGNSVQFKWSWCISRGDAEQAYQCNISETELQTAWARVDSGNAMPLYDLGTAETAQLPIVLTEETAQALCIELLDTTEASEQALFSCVSGLRVSIQLEVTTDTDTQTAIREIPGAESALSRNQNPVVAPVLMLVDNNSRVVSGSPLQMGQHYKMNTSIGMDQSERFIPKALDGEPTPIERRESLFLSWFVTVGNTHEEGSQRTSFVYSDEDVEGDFESLLKNRWQMTGEYTADQAQLYLILRDERGGVGWTEHTFGLEDVR